MARKRPSKQLFLKYPSCLRIFPLVLKVSNYTLLTYEILFQNYLFLKRLVKKNIRGVVVECGCWKGGNAAFMAKVSGRETWAFDSFEGMPERKTHDNKEGHKRPLEEGDLAVSEKEIQQIVEKLQVQNTVHIVKGWFNNTLSEQKKNIGQIALLRIDGDFYESTKTVLEELYDQVESGGYIIFDDYHDFEGCRKAIYEFFLTRDVYPDIKEFFPNGRPYVIKP